MLRVIRQRAILKPIEFFIAVFILGAFALRVFRLDEQSLWWDEIFAVEMARLPFGDMLAYLFWQDRAQTPGFFAILSLWTRMGNSEFIARFVSVIAGTLSIPLIYSVGSRVAGKKVGMIAALILAVSPFHVWYSQEARVYTLLGTCALGSSYLLLRQVESPRWREALGLGLVNAVGLYFHYLFSLVILAQQVFVILLIRKQPKFALQWLAGGVLTAVCFAPWIASVFITGGFTTAGIDWIPPVRWYDPLLSIYTFLLGSTNDPSNPINWLSTLAMIGFAAIGIWRYLRGGRDCSVRLLSLWLLVPMGMMFLVSLPYLASKRSIYVDRYLMAELPPLLILIAMGAHQMFVLHPRATSAALIVSVIPMVLSISTMYFEPAFAREDWRGIAGYIAAGAHSSNDRLAVEASTILPYSHYDRAGLKQVPYNNSDYSLLDSEMEKMTSSKSPQRVWLITATSPRDVHGFLPPVDERLPHAQRDDVKNLLDARFPIQSEVLFQGYVVTLYEVVP